MKRSMIIMALLLAILPAFAQTAGQDATQGAAQPAAAASAAPTASTDTSAAQPSSAPQAYGLPLTGTRTEEGRDFLVLTDPSGKELLLNAQTEPDASRMGEILALDKSLRSFAGADFGEVRVVNYADRFQLLALVSRFQAGDANVASALPGGLQFFSSKGGFEYDFRLKGGDYFLRVRGLYVDCDDLSKVIASALADPAAYFASTDPQSALGRINALEARCDKLAADNAKLSADNARLAYALIAALGGGKPVKPEAIKAIVDGRQADPKFDKAKAVAKLKGLGITLTGKELDAVFLVQFGE